MDMSEFKENGYVVVPGVFSDKFIRTALARSDSLVSKNPDIPPDSINQFRMDFDSTDYSLVSNDSLIKLAKAFVGPNVALFWMRYFMCQPFTGRAVPWHQDGAGQTLEPLEYIYFWVALDNVAKKSGMIQVIPGSHDNPIFPLRDLPSEPYPIMARAIDPALVGELGATKDIRMAAGDVLIIHPNLVLGCQPNLSTDWRRGLSIRYIAPLPG